MSIKEKLPILQHKGLIFYKVAFGLALSLFVSACGQPKPPETIVSERSQARWSLIVERNFEDAYAFYSPGFRQTVSQADYVRDIQRRPIAWKSADVSAVKCGEDKDAPCIVEVALGYQVTQGPAQLRGIENVRYVREQWIYINGDWWYANPE